MIWQAAKAEAIGGRKEQQDRVELFEARDGSERLLVLADGMGGHSGGALAAEAVVDTARALWSKHLLEPKAADALLRELIQNAHQRINAEGEEKDLSPRSTAVLLHITDHHAHWAHVGDSRLYRFRNAELVGRSLDHSVVQMLVDMGKVDEEEMATHPDQNRLTQSLGGGADPEPDLDQAEVSAGDGFVLCSDGLWEQITPEEMIEALAADALSVEAKRLAKLAAERGGADGDNVTIAMARADGEMKENRRRGGLLGLFSS
jgi:serine/threonine protein phosphatase PrpC